MSKPTSKPISKLVDVQLTEISLVDRPANQGSAVVLFKRDSEDDDMPTPQELEALQVAVTKAEEALGELTQANEDLVAKNAELTGQVETLKAEVLAKDDVIAKAATAKTEGEQDDITKAMADAPEPIAKAMQALIGRLEIAESVIAKQASERDEREFVTKAKAFDKLPTSAEKLGPLMMRVTKGMTTAEDAAELERLLKAANEGMGKPGDPAADPTTEIGKSGGDKGSTAEQRIDAKAAELRKADSKLTEAEAITKALEEDPALYEEYVQETRGPR